MLVKSQETDMDKNKEPQKENVWLVAAAGGVMLVCCLAPVLLVSGAAWFSVTGWFSGINPLGAIAIAIAVGVAVLISHRRRKAAADIGEDR